MEKYMTDDRSQRARAAAEAGTTTRDQLIREAWKAFLWDVTQARNMMPTDPEQLTHEHVDLTRVIIEACSYHLGEIERHLPQRDGYAAAQSLGPDVALNGWGSKR
jgi:hypothetical protein